MLHPSPRERGRLVYVSNDTQILGQEAESHAFLDAVRDQLRARSAGK